MIVETLGPVVDNCCVDPTEVDLLSFIVETLGPVVDNCFASPTVEEG